MTSAPHLLCGVGLVVFVTGCPLLDVAVEVQEVCLTYPDVAVEGQPSALAVTRSFVFDDLAAVHELVDHDADLQFVRAEVRAKSGVTELAFVDAARVTISSGDPTSALPPLTVYDCDGDCLAEGSRLAVPASVQQDAVEYVKTDSIVVDVAITGRLPSARWTMDVDVCMNGRIDYVFEP